MLELATYRLRELTVVAEQHLGEPLPLKTPFGTQVVRSGDWIVTDAKGRRWPSQADKFLSDYEPVTDVRPSDEPLLPCTVRT